MIRVHNVSGIGFLSFRDRFDLNLEPLEGRTVQIDGKNRDDPLASSNGSGKSSLLEAICWGLYGELSRGGRYADEVVNKGSKNCEITIEFGTADGDYVVERRRNRSGNSLSVRNKDGNMFPGATTTDVQIELNRLLGMDFVAFTSSVVWGQDFICFPDRKPAQRAELLSDLLNLSRFIRASDVAKRKATLVDNEIHRCEKSLIAEKTKREELEKKSFQDEEEEFEASRSAQLMEFKRQINGVKAELNAVDILNEKTREKLGNELSDIENVMMELESELAGKDEVMERYKEAERIFNEMGRKIDVLSSKADQIYENGKGMKKLGKGKCPTCNQEISEEHVKNCLEEMQREIYRIEGEIDPLSKEQSKAHQIMCDFDKQLWDLSEKEQKYKDKNLRAAALQETLNGIDTKTEPQKKALRGHMASLESQKEQAEKRENPFNKKEQERKRDLHLVKLSVKEIENEIRNYKYEKDLFLFWQDGFKRIRNMLFDSVRYALEDEVDYILSHYSKDVIVLLEGERETKSGTIKDEFHIRVLDSAGNEASYEMYSGGERQKVRLAISLGLAQVIKDRCGHDFNIRCFDEPNSALDDVGKESNFQVFNSLAKQGFTVLVTDHDAAFKDSFDHSVLVVKENGGSRIQ